MIILSAFIFKSISSNYLHDAVEAEWGTQSVAGKMEEMLPLFSIDVFGTSDPVPLISKSYLNENVAFMRISSPCSSNALAVIFDFGRLL